jgi:predicted permease
VVGRLKEGVTAAQARASLEPYYHGLLIMEMQTIQFRRQDTRAQFASKPLIFQPASRGVSDLRGTFEDPLLILLAIVAILLLIACANVANLLLARAVARQREMAVRLAIGASRWALVRQLVAESMVLSLGGGAIGILLSWWIASALLAGSPDLPISSSPDPRVLAFTVGLSLLTGLLFGLAPAWQATSPHLAVTLKDHAGSVSSSRSHVRLRKALVVSQVALSLLMLIASALFTRSLQNLKNVDLGFRRDRLLSFALDPSLASYKADRNRQFAADLQDRVSAVSGVRNAAVGVNAVVTGDQSVSSITIQGHEPKQDEDMNPWFDTVSHGYFATMGIPLELGREFTPRDRMGTQRVAIVNDQFVQYYFKGENPIGRRFGLRSGKATDIEIVGVVKGSKYSKVDEKTPRVAYLCYAQDENPANLVMYVRAARDPKSLFPTLRREVASLDATMPVTTMRTMEDQIDSSLSAKRIMSYLSAFFALLATVLAAIGLYGVMAYTVARRTREIGIRVALGAGKRSLLGLVMREVAILTGIGVAIAIPVALALSSLVRSQLYGIVPTDPLSIALASLVLIAVAMLAGYVPAERASRVDPIRALRYE